MYEEGRTSHSNYESAITVLVQANHVMRWQFHGLTLNTVDSDLTSICSLFVYSGVHAVS